MPEQLTVNELNALIQVSMTVNAHLALDTVLESIMSVTTDTMQVEASSLVLIDEGTEDLIFHVTRGGKASAIKQIRIKKGEGVVGWVVKSGNSAVVNNVAKDKRFCRKVDEVSGFKTRSILCVPLATQKRLWGAIEVINKLNGSNFNDQDRVVCEAIASQASIAIENAMLHEQIVKTERLAAIGQTIAGLAHCIKNVLNCIQGGSYMIDWGMRRNEIEKVMRGWEIVKENNSFMQDLVLDMLTYSKEREPLYEQSNVNEIIKSVCRMIEEKAIKNSIRISWSENPSLDNVLLDSWGIKRCLLNLVSNSVDACENGKERYVNVSTEVVNDKKFSIKISDNGCRIPREDLKKLFQLFFSTKGSKGTGLGLAVTSKIISEHKGTVKVESEVGHGTMFVITLPLKQEKSQKSKE